MAATLLFAFTALFVSSLLPAVSSIALCHDGGLSLDPTVVNGTVTHVTFHNVSTLVDISNSAFSINTDALPDFCRVQMVLVTDTESNSTANTEVWLPRNWTGRFMAFGNNGLSGGVNVADLGLIAVAQGIAGMSTDTGHTSSPDDGTWAGPGNDNAIIDWSWRAMHVSRLAAKLIMEQYYHRDPNSTFFMGCGDGGRQGLIAAQRFPTDFDGIIIGSPSNFLSHASAWHLHMNQVAQGPSAKAFVSNSLWTNVVHPEVLRQCDHLDGLVDGIVSQPQACNFRPETLACRTNQRASDCLNTQQIATVKATFASFELDHTFVFDGLMPGGELEFGSSLGQIPAPLALDYFRFMVLNDTSFSQNQLNLSMIQLADKIDPGSSNANSPDFTAFATAPQNGKILQYVGLADQTVGPSNSFQFLDSVQSFMESTSRVKMNEFFRLFTVPGMAHCSGGVGANAFGATGQAGAGMPPASLDATHNIVAAMILWVESGTAPTSKSLTATRWINNNSTNGIQFTRPLCQFPENLVFRGGNPNDAKSFECV